MPRKKYATHIQTPTGERVYIYGRTKKELEEKVFAARVDMNAGVNIADNTTFREYAELWYKSYKAPHLRPSSLAILRTNLDNHVLPVLGHMPMREIKPIHIQMLLSSVSTLSKSVQSKVLGAVRQITQTAVDNGLLARIPITSDLKAGGEETQEKTPLTEKQSGILLQAVKDTRAYLFVLLALTLGLRKGELLGLQWEDIDFASGLCNVRHNKSIPADKSDAPVTELLKTEAARRTLPIPPYVLQELRKAKLASASPFVFAMANGASLTRGSFRSLWAIVTSRMVQDGRQLGDRVPGSNLPGAVVSIDFPVTPHLLRHTCITRWLEAGMDIKMIQYLAGHSTLEMTMKTYAHFLVETRMPEAQEKSAAACQGLLAAEG